jgi:hypothetical protein
MYTPTEVVKRITVNLPESSTVSTSTVERTNTVVLPVVALTTNVSALAISEQVVQPVFEIVIPGVNSIHPGPDLYLSKLIYASISESLVQHVDVMKDSTIDVTDIFSYIKYVFANFDETAITSETFDYINGIWYPLSSTDFAYLSEQVLITLIQPLLVADGFSVIDSLLFVSNKAIDDNTSIAEILDTLSVFDRIYDDSLSNIDSISNDLTKPFADATSVSEVLSIIPSKVLGTDVTSATEALISGLDKIYVDATSIAEIVDNTAMFDRSLIDTSAIIEAAAYVVNLSELDTTSIGESGVFMNLDYVDLTYFSEVYAGTNLTF